MSNDKPYIEAVGNCTLSSPEFYPLPLRVSEIDDSKLYNKIIKNIELLVRRSYEYRLWREYILGAYGNNRCAISGEVSDEVTIELHHHPFRLYDIVRLVLDSFLINGKPFCTFDIATIVIEHHFNNEVGYVPLCKTLHEKHHNGYLDIAIELVSGNYKALIQKYTIPNDMMDKVSERMAIHETSETGLVNYDDSIKIEQRG